MHDKISLKPNAHLNAQCCSIRIPHKSILTRVLGQNGLSISSQFIIPTNSVIICFQADTKIAALFDAVFSFINYCTTFAGLPCNYNFSTL